MKCESCELDLSYDSMFTKGVAIIEEIYSVQIECPHCRLQQFIPIQQWIEFGHKRYQEHIKRLKKE